MANSDYTYAQVKSGTGSYKKESSTTPSSGVKTMQTRLNECGYDLTADGFFGQKTEDAVYAFQQECGLAADKTAGKNTLVQLDKVYTSTYFTSYGKPLTADKWGRDYILAGKVADDADLLSRCIWCEDENLDGQVGVAQVIKNRTTTSENGMRASKDTYKDASIWALVLGASGQYDSASATQSRSLMPRRGDSSKTDGISAAWKNAVDIAKKLTATPPETISPAKGYVVTGTTVAGTKTTPVSTQLYQVAASSYKKTYSTTAKDVVTYLSTLTGNVFFNK